MHLSDPSKKKNLKLAELTSGLGALVLGIGLGAYFAESIFSFAILIMVVGAFSHAWGMYDKNRIEKHLKQENVWWEKALYWLCWVLLIGLGIGLLVQH